MPERALEALARSGVAVALAGVLLSGCAGQPRPRTPAPSPAGSVPAELALASPAARDALEAGLRWIAADAPVTKVATAELSTLPAAPPAQRGQR